MNKNIPTIILSVAVAVLYVLHFANCGSNCPAKCTPASDTGSAPTTQAETHSFPVAYVNLDSLIFNYSLYKELIKEHEAKYKASEAQYVKQAEQLQKDIYEFQNKAQKGLITRAEGQQQEQALTMRQQELMQLEQSLSKDLMEKEDLMQKRIYDSVQVVLDNFNSDRKYRVILNNAFGNSLLDADKELNITDTILVLMNNKHK